MFPSVYLSIFASACIQQAWILMKTVMASVSKEGLEIWGCKKMVVGLNLVTLD